MRYFDFRKVKEEFRRLEYLQRLRGLRSNIRFRFIILTLLSVLVSFLVAYGFWDSGMPRQAVLMLAIFILAGLLWITEALPLFATALVIISAEIILIANPGDWPHLGSISGENPSYRIFLAPLSDPVIILFLGGFILAQASVKEGIDKALASNILKIFGQKPRIVMLGLMIITCLFSMWMSNTATTAMMITLTVPLIAQIPDGERFKKALVLCIPFAANIGGLGTPIASPPNAVAVGFLKNVGIDISFLEWMTIALPLVCIMLFFTWLLLWKQYKPKTDLKLTSESHAIDNRGIFVIVIFIITILLWLSDKWHGLPTAVVALVPVVAFTTTGIIRRSDINSLEWHILILIAGGIALGLGLKITGLDLILVDLIPKNVAVIFPLLVVVTVLLSTFMSNTAASNLLIPLGVSFAIGLQELEMAKEIGIGVALAASMAMSLPISTPPNAIAYSGGILNSRDFAKSGAIVGIVAIIILLVGKWVITHWL